MQERADRKPLINKEQAGKKKQIMEKGTMPLLISKSLRWNKQVFSIQVRNKTAYPCQ